MSLSSSLFSGISGLSTIGNAMTVIGDNIANVNTVGFKASRVTFQDVLSQTVATSAGTAQVGHGTSLADISSSFAQGSFESTDSNTDLAIGGNGFFVVRDPNSKNNEYYTRAGEFRFNKDGYFVNPAGYIVRGWALDPDTGQDQGTITDIVLNSFTSAPKKTDKVTIITNLNSGATSKSSSLSAVWDGADANKEYIGENEYEYQTTVKVYDSLGSTHDITIYFDKGSGSTYEYIVTCSPQEDKRTGIDAQQSGAGMLGRGTITFNEASGVISNISFDSFDPTNTITTIGSPVTSGTWTGAAPSESGTFSSGTKSRTYTFTVTTGGTVGDGINVIHWDDGEGNSGDISATAAAQAVGALGLQVSFAAGGAINAGESFTITCYGDNDVQNSNCWSTKSTATDLTNGYFTFNTNFLGGSSTDMSVKLNFGSAYNSTSGSWVNDSLSTTHYASSSTTTFQTSNGYGAGDLQSVTVGTDGAITGQYSNGQVIPLYRVALAKFQNNQGLYKEGGNLFRETRLSGSPITSKPGTNGLGNISPNSLEQSNVDIATEFVKMITTQRGFQANSKIITVTDQMLAELINLKR
ncbi:MAG: flagellar hook protein FlgE [Deltaproteobacteria bacterium]|nr:flagellar hook protein FlgE [Deltaproteobacteria bacterium]MBW1918594.1 flagellar hook protein FlgE [Deltaproteobacteria bacterium]MBW1934034.1 flagellar hook protein FlgE [Deltaproteobacteria bacterium]MBW1976394.1 flagellar hook protein FlgE [Deltaproteobacteria bacterium]MBW2043328.1 flagellar hook protein FlgE [Deltaproteobacteria bacterium]